MILEILKTRIISQFVDGQIAGIGEIFLVQIRFQGIGRSGVSRNPEMPLKISWGDVLLTLVPFFSRPRLQFFLQQTAGDAVHGLLGIRIFRGAFPFQAGRADLIVEIQGA